MKKRVWGQLIIVVIAAGILMTGVCYAERWDRDATLEECFKEVAVLRVTPQRYEKVFRASEKQANFTFFNGVENVAVQDGKLTFTTTAEKATLGWGNYIGAQKVSEIADLWPEHNSAEIRVKQSAEKSSWQARYWVDGHAIRTRTAPEKVDVTGTDWQEVVLNKKFDKSQPTPDGLEVTIEAPKGTRFEMEWIKFVQPEIYEGYLRKEFVLPPGKIWRAVADVSWGDDTLWSRTREQHTLFLNGQHVERRTASGIYALLPVDIAQYLKPGKNCAAFYGYRIGYYPYLTLRATIIMESGEVITVNSDNTWKRSPKQEPNWNLPGFDDSAWEQYSDAKPPYIPYQQATIPADHGFLKLRNPYKRDFFYASAKDVVIQVLAPPGFANRSPQLEYIFAKADKEGNTTPVANGTVSSFKKKEGSLLYEINLGKREGGVYTIALRLMGSDKAVIGDHAREPLIVIENKPLKEISGTDYKEGLDLELEDSIDFTNPKDPHPSFECIYVDYLAETEKVEKPRIVRKNGLVYREMTGKTRMSAISYRLKEFKHPGDFYLMELEYPDDADRAIDVSISTKLPGQGSNSQSGVGAETGGKFYNTGKIQTLRWLHVADSGVHSIDILNSATGWPAAAKSLKIYHVKGDLPSAGSGSSRYYGIYTERCHIKGGHGINFGRDTQRPYKEEAELKKQYNITQWVLMQLSELLETADRYAQYLKFSGQNINQMGCVQYSDFSNTPFVRGNIYYDSPRIAVSFRRVLANVLEAREIDLLCGIQLSHSNRIGMETRYNNAQVARGADTIWMIDEKGNQFYGIGLSTTVANWQHPLFKQAYLNIINDIVDTFGDLKNFKGITNLMDLCQRASYYPPAYGFGPNYDNSMVFSFDDVTIGKFEADTGVDLGISKNDPKRFDKRAALLKDPRMKQKFLDWRCRKLVEFWRDAVAFLNKKDPRAQFINVIPIGGSQAACKYLVENNETCDSLLKRFAIDMGALGKIPNHWLLRWTVSWRARLGAQNPYLWIPKEREIIVSAFENIPRRAVLCRTSWDEIHIHKPGIVPAKGTWKIVESDWMMDLCKLRIEPQPAGYNAREAMIQGIITGDPQSLFTGFTDAALNLGHEDVLREVMRQYTHLPQDSFEPVLNTNLETMLAIRKLSKGGQSWFYIANPGYWHISGTVSIKAGGPILDVVTGKKVMDGGEVKLPVKLAPFGFMAYQVPSGTLDIRSYQTKPITKAELSHMTGIMKRVEELMADRQIRVALSAEDRAFMEGIIAQVRDSINKQEYALAWSQLKHHRFWEYWKEFLEKAAGAVAFLPESIELEKRSDDPDALPTLKVARATGPMVIDGKLTEADWKKVKFSGGFRTAEKKQLALNETAVKALYDDNALYMGFICADRHPEKLKAIAKMEMQVFSTKDDVLAVIVQPDETYPLYYQMAINTKGVRFDQRVKGGIKEYETFTADWKAMGSADKQYWTAEVMLPFSAFGLTGKGGTNWRINFGRAMRDSLLDVSSWSLAASWHDMERFGKMVFLD